MPEIRSTASSTKEAVYNAASEVSAAIVTAVATTIVSFVPVFTMEAAEGKLFKPLAFTKTFALVAALIVALLLLPSIAHWLLGWKVKKEKPSPKKPVPKYRKVLTQALPIIAAVYLLGDRCSYWRSQIQGRCQVELRKNQVVQRFQQKSVERVFSAAIRSIESSGIMRCLSLTRRTMIQNMRSQ